MDCDFFIKFIIKKSSQCNQKQKTVDEYMVELPKERFDAINLLRETILKNIPIGFVEEEMNYGMIGYVVPHSLYPKGYHCNPTLPLPFINVASQKKLHCYLSYGDLCESNPTKMVY